MAAEEAEIQAQVIAPSPGAPEAVVLAISAAPGAIQVRELQTLVAAAAAEPILVQICTAQLEGPA